MINTFETHNRRERSAQSCLAAFREAVAFSAQTSAQQKLSWARKAQNAFVQLQTPRQPWKYACAYAFAHYKLSSMLLQHSGQDVAEYFVKK